MKKAIVIGASSGIGKELAIELSGRGYAVGMVARRVDLLNKLKGQLKGESFVKQIDISRDIEAIERLEELLEEMGGADMIIINAAVGLFNPEFTWEIEKRQLGVNVMGFAAMANVAFKHLCERGKGSLVGVSSFACLRGSASAESYSASKAFVSNYLEGLRMNAMKKGLDVKVTDVRPGFVDTSMSRGQKGMFWIEKPQNVAKKIIDSAESGRPITYISARWRILASIVRNMPDCLYKKV